VVTFRLFDVTILLVSKLSNTAKIFLTSLTCKEHATKEHATKEHATKEHAIKEHVTNQVIFNLDMHLKSYFIYFFLIINEII
jgi:hypothetical protein